MPVDPNITPKERAHLIDGYRKKKFTRGNLEAFLGPFDEIKELKPNNSEHVKTVIKELESGDKAPKKSKSKSKSKKKKGGDDSVSPPKMVFGGP